MKLCTQVLNNLNVNIQTSKMWCRPSEVLSSNLNAPLDGRKAAHTLDVQCTPCKHDVPKLGGTCQCVEVSVLSTPCIAWHDGNQGRFDFRRAVPPTAVPSCKCVDHGESFEVIFRSLAANTLLYFYHHVTGLTKLSVCGAQSAMPSTACQYKKLHGVQCTSSVWAA
ncbi:hypothetical protein J6590_009843 [Homalodisca vitripennis]|nr:hypothetical protein J6590_009843 [Homalodisca vitripennis]